MHKLGYVPSFNCPYNQEIYDVSGYGTDPPIETYTTDPRYILFKYLILNIYENV